MARVDEKQRDRFEVLPTELPGVQLRVKPGVKVDILRKTIKIFYELARQFAATKFQIDNLGKGQRSRHEEIILVLSPKGRLLFQRK